MTIDTLARRRIALLAQREDIDAEIKNIDAQLIDADDARLLLTALGLLADGELAWPEAPSLDVINIKEVAATGAGGAGFR